MQRIVEWAKILPPRDESCLFCLFCFAPSVSKHFRSCWNESTAHARLNANMPAAPFPLARRIGNLSEIR